MTTLLNSIDNKAALFYNKTTSMFNYFKSKIVSFHIPTPAPFSKVNKWFFTWKNRALLVEENKIIAYHQARIECYGYHGYGDEHQNERSIETNMYILQQYKKKVEELESFKKELEQKNLILRSSEEKDNILVQYTELILSYQNYKIPALKKVIEENNNGIEHNVIQIRKDNIDEVVGNKISEIKKQYEQLITDLKTQHDNDKLEIRRQYHVADEGHVNEIRGLQKSNDELQQNNAQLQKLIDEQTKRLKHLENNSKYIELNSKLQHEEERRKELFLEKEAIISRNTELQQEILRWRNELNLKNQEIQQVKNEKLEEVKHHILLAEQEKIRADSALRKLNNQALFVTELSTENDGLKSTLQESQSVLKSERTSYRRYKKLENIEYFQQAEKHMLSTIEKMEKVIKINREGCQQTAHDLLVLGKLKDDKINLDLTLKKEQEELFIIVADISNMEKLQQLKTPSNEQQNMTTESLDERINKLQNNNNNEQQFTEAIDVFSKKKAQHERKISELETEIKKKNLMLEQQSQMIKDRIESLNKEISEAMDIFQRVKLSFAKSLKAKNITEEKPSDTIENNKIPEKEKPKISVDSPKKDNNHSNFDSTNFKNTQSLVKMNPQFLTGAVRPHHQFSKRIVALTQADNSAILSNYGDPSIANDTTIL